MKTIKRTGAWPWLESDGFESEDHYKDGKVVVVGAAKNIGGFLLSIAPAESGYVVSFKGRKLRTLSGKILEAVGFIQLLK